MHHRDTKRLRELDAGHAFYIPASEYRLPGTDCFQRISMLEMPAQVAYSNIGERDNRFGRDSIENDAPFVRVGRRTAKSLSITSFNVVNCLHFQRGLSRRDIGTTKERNAGTSQLTTGHRGNSFQVRPGSQTLDFIWARDANTVASTDIQQTVVPNTTPTTDANIQAAVIRTTNLQSVPSCSTHVPYAGTEDTA